VLMVEFKLGECEVVEFWCVFVGVDIHCHCVGV